MFFVAGCVTGSDAPQLVGQHFPLGRHDSAMSRSEWRTPKQSSSWGLQLTCVFYLTHLGQ